MVRQASSQGQSFSHSWAVESCTCSMSRDLRPWGLTMCLLSGLLCSFPLLFSSPSLTNSDYRLWNVEWQKRYRLLVSSDQMRRVQLLLYRLKEHLYSRGGLPYIILSLTHPPCTTASVPLMGHIICQCWGVVLVSLQTTTGKTTNCNFSTKLLR